MFILILKVIINTHFIRIASGSIAGISYMDSIVVGKKQNTVHGSNPCNPLYWYPRHIPEYCFEKTPETYMPPNILPVPIPVPQHVPLAPNYPIPCPPSPAPVYLPPQTCPMQSNIPIAPLLTMSPQLYPNPMIAAPLPYQSYYQQELIGMVPGLPGIVSFDGGINILPFSDAYSDLLEKHKHKELRKRLQKILQDYKQKSKRSHRH